MAPFQVRDGDDRDVVVTRESRGNFVEARMRRTTWVDAARDYDGCQAKPLCSGVMKSGCIRLGGTHRVNTPLEVMRCYLSRPQIRSCTREQGITRGARIASQSSRRRESTNTETPRGPARSVPNGTAGLGHAADERRKQRT